MYKQTSSGESLSSLSAYTTRTLGKTAQQLTCPVLLDSKAEAYAVCSETRYEVCKPIVGSATLCSYEREIMCKEVCTSPRFCAEPDAIHGHLVYRQHGKNRTPAGKACCFK